MAFWVIAIITSRGEALVFERATENFASAIPGEASACIAAMLTRGIVLLLVTSWSGNVSRSLPTTSSITVPDVGFW